MSEGIDGLLREKTRPPGIPRTANRKIDEVVRLTLQPPPHEATHWIVWAMGKAASRTIRSVLRSCQSAISLATNVSMLPK